MSFSESSQVKSSAETLYAERLSLLLDWADPGGQSMSQHSLLLLPGPHFWITYIGRCIYYQPRISYSVSSFSPHNCPMRKGV